VNGTWNDRDGSDVTLSASYGSITKNANGPGTWSWSASDGDGPSSTTVVITATAPDNMIGTTSFTYVVNSLPPSGGSFTNNWPRNEGSTATVSFSGQWDPSTADRNAGYTYWYDFDGDFSPDLVTGASSVTVPASFLADGPSTRTVNGIFFDKNSGNSGWY